MPLRPAPDAQPCGTFHLERWAGYKTVTDDLLVFSKLPLKIYSQNKMEKGEGKQKKKNTTNPRLKTQRVLS